MNILYTYTDGGCWGNNSPNYSERRMVWVVTDQHGDILVEEREELGGSSNIAEILAIHSAVKYATENSYEAICITTDSRVSQAWVNGWLGGKTKVGKKINDPERVISLLKSIRAMSEEVAIFIRWRPRGENLAGQYIENKYTL